MGFILTWVLYVLHLVGANGVQIEALLGKGFQNRRPQRRELHPTSGLRPFEATSLSFRGFLGICRLGS